MGDQFSEARNRAKSTIQTKWQALARVRTLGWGGPIESIEEEYPFIRESTSKLGGSVSPHLPIMIFQSRETPPREMEVAVPLRDATGNPYNSRIVPSGPVAHEHLMLLTEFAQALWFAIDEQMLPSPRSGRAFEEALIAWTGKALLGQ
jgi:hypothetical protein